MRVGAHQHISDFGNDEHDVQEHETVNDLRHDLLPGDGDPPAISFAQFFIRRSFSSLNTDNAERRKNHPRFIIGEFDPLRKLFAFLAKNISEETRHLPGESGCLI
jgi:hypothetical protein